MTRKILLSLSLLSTGICFAVPLTPEQALERLNGDMTATRSISEVKPLKIVNTKIGEPALYVFGNNDAIGYSVVSADDAVTPLLGYSDEGILDPENMPPALQYWLEQYARQVEYMRENPSMFAGYEETRTALPNNWSKIQPLVKTQWNQGVPYYNDCPTLNGTPSNTGCVATAMAQVMKYFNYPEKGQGKISYKCETLGKTLSMDFSTKTFDWDNMINSYSGNYTKQQADAVANLMAAAGYSVEMQYSTGTSGTQSGKILTALVDYFNYDPNIRYYARDYYTYTEFATLLYNNLQNVGPVIYDGTSYSASGTNTLGHSFICDGYQGDGYFHFNWGWAGSSDGYFLLDALNPPSLGIGGGSGGFNFEQDIIAGIQPLKGDTPVTEQRQIVIYGSVEGVSDSNNLFISLGSSSTLGWSFQGYQSIICDLGASFVPVNNPNATPINVISENRYNVGQELVPGEYMPLATSVDLRPVFSFKTLASSLEKGVQYKVTNVYRAKGGDWSPVMVENGSYNYFYLTVSGNGTSESDYSIDNFKPIQFTCNELSLDSRLYNGVGVEVSASVKNETDSEITRGLALALIDEYGDLRYLGSCNQITLSPGESYGGSWVSNIYSQTNQGVSRATKMFPGLYDPNTNTIYYVSDEAVTMYPNPGVPSFTVTLEIDNANIKNDIYQVENASNFSVTTTIKVVRNVFSLPAELWVAYMGNNGGFYRILSYPYEQMIINEGKSATIQTQVNFSDAVVGKSYYMIYYDSNSNTAKSPIRFTVLGNAGVDDLISNATGEITFLQDKGSSKLYAYGDLANVEVYSLNGMKLSPKVSFNPDCAEIDLSSLNKGIVLVNATDNQGNRKTIKLAL